MRVINYDIRSRLVSTKTGMVPLRSMDIASNGRFMRTTVDDRTLVKVPAGTLVEEMHLECRGEPRFLDDDTVVYISWQNCQIMSTSLGSNHHTQLSQFNYDGSWVTLWVESETSVWVASSLEIANIQQKTETEWTSSHIDAFHGGAKMPVAIGDGRVCGRVTETGINVHNGDVVNDLHMPIPLWQYGDGSRAKIGPYIAFSAINTGRVAVVVWNTSNDEFQIWDTDIGYESNTHHIPIAFDQIYQRLYISSNDGSVYIYDVSGLVSDTVPKKLAIGDRCPVCNDVVKERQLFYHYSKVVSCMC